MRKSRAIFLLTGTLLLVAGSVMGQESGKRKDKPVSVATAEVSATLSVSIFSSAEAGAALCGALVLLLLPRVAPAQAPSALPRAEPRPPSERRTPVVAAAEKSRGAVVNVSAEEMVRVRVPTPGADMGQLLYEEFFGKPRFRSGYAVTSLGSGVIVSPDGHVLTNAHVVERGARFRVQLLDGRELPARVLGTDPASDLAVLRVETKERLPFLPAGRSDDLMIGETVIAIGNPFGLAHTVTTGVVSALHRKVGDPRRQLFDMVQTDASINRLAQADKIFLQPFSAPGAYRTSTQFRELW